MPINFSKYAVVGTSCSGKTALINLLGIEIKKAYPEKKINIVPEAARIYFKRNLVRNPFSYSHQSKIQELALKQEMDARSGNASLILCDRSVIDSVVYVKTMGNKKGSTKLLNRIKKWLSTYTHFFILDPKDVSYIADDIRKENKDLREKFHAQFIDFFSCSNIPHSFISGTIEERIVKVTGIIYSTWHAKRDG